MITKTACAEVHQLANEGAITLELREYTPADLEGRLLVVAATEDTPLNVEIYRRAEERAMLVNIVDVPPLCNFILPAIVRSGPIAIAISTSGASPALAKRLKREILETYGEPHAEFAVMLNGIRGWAKDLFPTYNDRKIFFEGLVNGDPDPIEMLRAGDTEGVRALIRERQDIAETMFVAS